MKVLLDCSRDFGEVWLCYHFICSCAQQHQAGVDRVSLCWKHGKQREDPFVCKDHRANLSECIPWVKEDFSSTLSTLKLNFQLFPCSLRQSAASSRVLFFLRVWLFIGTYTGSRVEQFCKTKALVLPLLWITILPMEMVAFENSSVFI